jgi:2-C-methyl-D-erythritol 2,4-cyclodiphosphate synthase
MLLENIGADIYAVDLGYNNIKITTQEDLRLAKNILTERGENVMNGFRVGHGYDVHKLVTGRKLILGGVEIPHETGLLGHSDADVLLHAIMDALLGAAALGDIGKHFPDTSEEYKGISSLHLLTRVADLIKKKGFSVLNIDATIVMQRPKIATFIPKMVSNIAFAIGIAEDCINVKATTEEHLGFTGREEGVSAHCVAMLVGR